MKFHLRLAVMFLLFIMLCGGCVQSEARNGANVVQERIFFTEPATEANVTSPLTLKFGAENFTIEPASETLRPGHGHLHVMVDTACVAAGEGIPNDETHLHFGKAQMETVIELTPGEHTLCLQAGDGNHIAVAGEGMTHSITVTVE